MIKWAVFLALVGVFSGWTAEVVIDGGGEVLAFDGTSTNLLSDDFKIGVDQSENGVRVLNGGFVGNNATWLGTTSASSNNFIEVTGSSSEWSLEGDLYLGHEGAGNRLQIGAGARMEVASGWVGVGAGARRNAISVTGTGSRWMVREGLVLGHYGGDNLLTVSDGAFVYCEDCWVGHFAPSSKNVLIVEGQRSQFFSSALYMYVGFRSSSNQLQIVNGGLVTAQRFNLGNHADSGHNRLLVSGAGSHLRVSDINNRMYIGVKGSSNAMVIEQGGRVSDSYGHLGHDASSWNNVGIVRGTGSVWTNRLDLFVGNSGSFNTLRLEEGGHVWCENADIGSRSSSVHNRAVIDGKDSFWFCHQEMLVGKAGSFNGLTITNGGTLICVGNGYVGSESPAQGNEVEVSGYRSDWEVGGALMLGTDGAWNNALRVKERGIIRVGQALSNQFGSMVELASSGKIEAASYVQDDHSELRFILSANSSGVLKIVRAARLGGTLTVRLDDSYSPQVGDSFKLFHWGTSPAGSFKLVNLPELPAGMSWNRENLLVGGTLSIAAGPDYEQEYADWCLFYFGGLVAKEADPDGDLVSNWAEFVGGSNPTNRTSLFQLQAEAGSNYVVVSWTSVTNRRYFVRQADVLTGSFDLVQSVDYPLSSFTDIVSEVKSAGYYRVEAVLE
jgi:T5SS/PEP-CTERM-associated repeat protein